MLTESTLSNWLASAGTTGVAINMKTTRVGDIDLTQTNEEYSFVGKDKTIYEVQDLFEKRMMSKKRL